MTNLHYKMSRHKYWKVRKIDREEILKFILKIKIVSIQILKGIFVKRDF